MGPSKASCTARASTAPCRFERKSREDVQATIGAKVDGAYHLMTLTRQDPVRHFIGFGSISGRLGSNGQTDYCLASDMLCKLMGWYRTQRPECRAVGFHWHPWDEIGMAARPQARATFQIHPGAATRCLSTRASAICCANCMPACRGPKCSSPTGILPAVLRPGSERKHRRRRPATAAARGGRLRQRQRRPRVARRYVLRMFDAPLPTGAAGHVADRRAAALILGENREAAALAQRLRPPACVVTCLPADDDAQAG